MDNRILVFAVFLIIAYMLFNKRESLAVGGDLWSYYDRDVIRHDILRNKLLHDGYRRYHHHRHPPHFWRPRFHNHHHFSHYF